MIIDTEMGILLQPKTSFQESKLNEVAGCLDYEGTAKTIDADQIAGALIQLISLPNVHINHLNRVAQAIT